MLIAVDFDGTIVRKTSIYTPLELPLEIIPGCLDGLLALKRAGHTLLLYSARSNRAMRTPYLGLRAHGELDQAWWDEACHFELRYQQMLQFVNEKMPGVFDAIDDGSSGKPLADLFIDDRCIKHHPQAIFNAMDWEEIAHQFGE